MFDFSGVLGTSPRIREIFDLLALVAPSEATVLLLGETGTGKELVAQAIHRNSPRAAGPFVAVNCAALPEALLESELFGHERGSFTGATNRRDGRFVMAHQGSLFLDEVGELSLPIQAKILRVLQAREFEPLGSTRTVKVDVRIITATNRDLEKMVREGRFREDLYYRLNVFPVVLPPLRERQDDLPALAEFFLKKFGEKNRREGISLDARGAGGLSALFLAGQYPGVGKCYGTGGDRLPGNRHHPGTSAPGCAATRQVFGWRRREGTGVAGTGTAIDQPHPGAGGRPAPTGRRNPGDFPG